MIPLVLFLLSPCLFAAQPNQFDCEGSAAVKVNYSASSFAGIPLLSFSDGKKTWHADSESIKKVKNFQGEWVTGELKNGETLGLFLIRSAAGEAIVSLQKGSDTRFLKVACKSTSVVF